MKKKLPLVFSFTLAALIVVGQAGFAHGSNHDSGNMMNGSGMDKGNMSKMMDRMHSTKGNEMMQSCMDFMQSFGDDKKEN